MIAKLTFFWHHLPCIYAGGLGTVLASPFAILTDGDVFTRIAMMFGAGGLAAVIIAFTRFKVAGSMVRKTDSETMTDQFLIITKQLQADKRALLRASVEREIIATLERNSKHKYQSQLTGAEAAIHILSMQLAGAKLEPAFKYTFLGYEDLAGIEDKEIIACKRKIAQIVDTPDLLDVLAE